MKCVEASFRALSRVLQFSPDSVLISRVLHFPLDFVVIGWLHRRRRCVFAVRHEVERLSSPIRSVSREVVSVDHAPRSSHGFLQSRIFGVLRRQTTFRVSWSSTPHASAVATSATARSVLCCCLNRQHLGRLRRGSCWLLELSGGRTWTCCRTSTSWGLA